MSETTTHFLTDDDLRSANQTFYPTGKVFAMMPDASAAQHAALALQSLTGARGVCTASASEIVKAFGDRVEEIRSNPPSVGREEQFMVRFHELAQDGEHGLLFTADGDLDEQAAKSTLQDAACSVAYRYGRLVIEEWIAPDRSAKAAAAGTL